MKTISYERQLQAVEEDIRLGESLVKRISALAVTNLAGEKALRMREVCRMLATADDVLVPLHAVRSRLLHAIASQR